MTKEVMERNASDNEYLHKDFHGALSNGLTYLAQRYGEQAVRDYLRQFALPFYAPLTEDIKNRGLKALQEHFEKIYATEGGEIEIDFTEECMELRVKRCPAVTHMREKGYQISPLFYETERTVNKTICEGTPFEAELVEYDTETGKSVQRFSRRNNG